jgi:enoyl-CoA hydratase
VTGARVSYILVDKPHPHVSRITLNRPERMNAMAFDVMIPFRDAIDEVAVDNDTRVLVITGAGTGFCSGADLEDPGRVPDIEGLGPPAIAQRAGRLLHDVIIRLHDLPIPVIAAINGPAIGGGFCLAAACDIRVASEGAYFRAAGVNNGLTSAELGLSFTLPRAIGSSRAMELMLTGRDMPAEEALSIGFLSAMTEPDALFERCFEIADQIIRWSRAGIELSKQMAWAGLESSSFHTHVSHEMNSQLLVRMTTGNFEEAIAARKQDRAPNFTDGL